MKRKYGKKLMIIRMSVIQKRENIIQMIDYKRLTCGEQ